MRVEKAYEKHAWKIWIIGAAFQLLGIFQIILAVPPAETFRRWTGMTWSELVTSSPRVANLISYYSTLVGRDSVVLGFLTLAIALTGYKRGEKWAWYTLWFWPVFLVYGILLQFVYFDILDSLGFVGLALVLLALLLPIRKFFPRK